MEATDIYTELDDLIVLLRNSSNNELAAILEHRMYKVTWTSGSELLECIADILGQELRAPRAPKRNAEITERMREILEDITSSGYY
jgi:hypothetical protein